MKSYWDYTDLADAYLKRPDYAPEAIEKIFALTGIAPGQRVCDMGAGVGHLTTHLAARGLDIIASEPNHAMRANGIQRTNKFNNVTWVAALAEQTGFYPACFDMVTFGSSFNVTDRQRTLLETARILKSDGWFVCLWNHRDLDDPLQAAVETIIKERVTGYTYGSRRENQTPVIMKSGLYESVTPLDGRITHRQPKAHLVEAWRSHATLKRQAGECFENIITAIEACVLSQPGDWVTVPYVTRAWIARNKGEKRV